MGQGNGSRRLTGAELEARSRREVELPDGRTVLVGRLAPDELARIMENLPDVSALATATEGEAEDLPRRPESRKVIAMMQRVIRAGVIDPELVDDRKQGRTAQDFDLDEQLLIFKAILDLSRYTRKAGAEVLPLSRTGA